MVARIGVVMTYLFLSELGGYSVIYVYSQGAERMSIIIGLIFVAIAIYGWSAWAGVLRAIYYQQGLPRQWRKTEEKIPLFASVLGIVLASSL